MFFSKTDKAFDELRPGRRTLTQRERALLLMADGQRSMTDFVPLFADRDEARRIAQNLVTTGYLAFPATPITVAPAADVLPPAPVAADRFDGQRSLASARMFLFDLCERMFARRDPAAASELRDALRASRDRASMLAVAQRMLLAIEQAAGAERAASVRERLDKLLPLDLH
ncbi:MAG: hypothetical protein EOP81_01725 [Variovorax sp.]|nr:MAG: hypothetical protein EOP81_01725 [Variovorax sp.]